MPRPIRRKEEGLQKVFGNDKIAKWRKKVRKTTRVGLLTIYGS